VVPDVGSRTANAVRSSSSTALSRRGRRGGRRAGRR
jgi:hypothetical protein